MPGPIVSRPLLRNPALLITSLATLLVTGMLTIASGGSLNFAGGVANGALFLDDSKNASSSIRILMNGNSGTVTSTVFVSGFSGFSTAGGFVMKNGSVSGGLTADGTYLYLGTFSGGGSAIRFPIAGTSQIDITTAGLVPSLTDGVKNIGAQSARFGTGFFASVSSTNVTSTRFEAIGSTSIDGYRLSNGVNTASFTFSGGSVLSIGSDGSNVFAIKTGGSNRWAIDTTGNLYPATTDGTLNFGATASRVGSGFFARLNASTTAGVTFTTPAITASGTLRIANQASPTTTLEMTGRFCMKVLDMVGGTQRYITVASGAFVISTTDCR